MKEEKSNQHTYTDHAYDIPSNTLRKDSEHTYSLLKESIDSYQDKTQNIYECSDGTVTANNNCHEDLDYRLSSHFLNNRKKSPMTSSFKHLKLDQENSGSGESNNAIKLNENYSNSYFYI